MCTNLQLCGLFHTCQSEVEPPAVNTCLFVTLLGKWLSYIMSLMPGYYDEPVASFSASASTADGVTPVTSTASATTVSAVSTSSALIGVRSSTARTSREKERFVRV